MKLSEKEKASHKEAFRNMNLQDRIDYIFSYYKAYIIVPLVILILAGHFIYARITRKEEVLYLAAINIAAGEDLTAELTDQFIEECFEAPKKKRVTFYPELYITDDASSDNNRYAYASRVKLLGTIETKKLDAVILNREAYDLLSRSGYLLDLTAYIGKESLVYNDVLIHDNRIDHLLDEEIEEDLSSYPAGNGIDISAYPIIRKAGFPETVYLCVIANTPRIDTVLTYIDYLKK